MANSKSILFGIAFDSLIRMREEYRLSTGMVAAGFKAWNSMGKKFMRGCVETEYHRELA
jgi:hypothetical protein